MRGCASGRGAALTVLSQLPLRDHSLCISTAENFLHRHNAGVFEKAQHLQLVLHRAAVGLGHVQHLDNILDMVPQAHAGANRREAALADDRAHSVILAKGCPPRCGGSTI